MKPNDREFKSHSGERVIITSKHPSVMNAIVIW